MLTPQGVNEPGFQQWLAQNRVPFDPGQSADYDMRGFYNALMRNDPRAATAVNTNDQQLHFPDYWKMPTHQSFSGESQWAGPMAPQWINDSQLASPGGRILFDEKALARLRSGDYRRR
jgi:hypothetical protein